MGEGVMLPGHQDPIIAIATAPGRGAVGIVRVSGQSIEAAILALCGRKLKAREATYLAFLREDGSPIDRGLAIHFPAPHSFTGEDVLELQAHGGPVVLQLLVARLLGVGLKGARLAQPGEFSQRAFLNGKIDLTQAEAISDLIDASTEAAARSASRSLSGEFSRKIYDIRDALVHLRMLVEATLDFPEEEIDFLKKTDARGQLSSIEYALRITLGHARRGALLREGIKVVIVGQPNAGKSSLLNALAGAELAIVTPLPGTTRDKIQETIQIEGVPVHVVDTAGLRDSDDQVEKIGIERAWTEISAANVVLFLHDLTEQHDPQYRQRDVDIRRALEKKIASAVPILDVWNKADVASLFAGSEATTASIPLSAKTGKGLAALRARLLEIAGWQPGTEGVFIARERHVTMLVHVLNHLLSGQERLSRQTHEIELLAEDLRLAHQALSEITGEFTPDDLLGEIFSKFCIGK